MNQTITDILNRRSIRKYTSEQITDDELNTILQAGLYAASGMDRQSTKLIAVQSKADIAVLSKMNAKILGTSSDPFYGAPTVVIVLTARHCPTGIEDASLVLGNMMLAAHTLGLGSCWIHRAREEFASSEGKTLLQKWGIDGEYIGVGHCLLGYQDGPAGPNPPRKQDRIKIIK